MTSSSETLTILARDKKVSVRWRVAYNPNTPPEILTILAQDEYGGFAGVLPETPTQHQKS